MTNNAFCIFQCENQAQNCFRGKLNYFSSTAQQLITRGPIKPVPRKPKSLQPPGKIPDGEKIPNLFLEISIILVLRLGCATSWSPRVVI